MYRSEWRVREIADSMPSDWAFTRHGRADRIHASCLALAAQITRKASARRHGAVGLLMSEHDRQSLKPSRGYGYLPTHQR